MKAFGDNVQENLKAPGFVIDLRGNPGGIAAMAQGLGGWFVDRDDLKLGTTIYRNGVQHSVLNPQHSVLTVWKLPATGFSELPKGTKYLR